MLLTTNMEDSMGKYNCAVDEKDDPVCYCGKPGQWGRNDGQSFGQSLFLCDDCFKQMQEDEVEMVAIPVDEYRRLKHAEAVLEALQGCGVDNWEGYDDAMQDVPNLEDIELW